MIFFGIDPGSSVTGYGIICTTNNTIKFEDAGIIAADPRSKLAEKLEYIYDTLDKKMKEIRPDCVCIEQAFYAKNVHTTLVLGHARGVAMLAAQKSCAEIVEYSPREIKKAVVGNGNATKEQVIFMVRTILRIPDKKIHSDMYDALAASICAYNNFSL
ncbi:MAG: crossover junction endodeoxyribonuclease RuvC [Chitinispirillia bacterium]